ncbi:MAG TPA: ABC transporter ATP-binding protein [Gemmatimonadaceae bacterium]|nr:ABC transporter ATP-binding protein [Gemmatimonadaceae bacterium]
MTEAIRLTDIVKTFGPVVANDRASLEVAAGEIHALVGENGAGKSTLMRVLSGMYAPQSGRMEVNGRDVTGWTTAEAIAAGVGMVHQHFMLVPTLTVAENVMLGAELRSGMQLDRDRAVREVEELSRKSGLVVDPRRLVSDLNVGEAQRVEILKALFRGAKILILDEPTAVLSPGEVSELWAVLRTMRAAGSTIVLITHKLDEVMQISDRITVMRRGMTVGRMSTAGTTPADIARAMVGRDVTLAASTAFGAGAPTTTAGNPMPDAARTPPISVSNLVVHDDRGRIAVDGVSFDVAAGEILGVAGVEGNGQTQLIEAIAGLRRAESGAILIDGRDLNGLSVRQRGDAGLSHIPEDRHERGLILDYSIAENLVLGQQHHYTRRGAIDRARLAANAGKQIAAYDIRPATPGAPARTLSGGNQQKVVIAREMSRDFKVLLAAQPTRGVDVGAIEFIHAQLRAARDAGKAILLVSADLTEILALSDRIAVMYEGRFATTLPRSAASEEVLGPYMTGAAETLA